MAVAIHVPIVWFFYSTETDLRSKKRRKNTKNLKESRNSNFRCSIMRDYALLWRNMLQTPNWVPFKKKKQTKDIPSTRSSVYIKNYGSD